MLTADQASGQADRLLELAAAEWSRLKLFDQYHRGVQSPPYTPQTATIEFRTLVARATTNLMPMVTGTLVNRLYADGFRPDPTQDANSTAWEWWQANQMDARQKPLYEAVAVYGYAWMMVTDSGSGAPEMSPKSPRTWYCEIADPDDDWPTFAVRRRGENVTLVDDEAFYTLTKPTSSNRWGVVDVAPHGLGVCPFVQYRNAWNIDGHPVGEVERLIPVQDRLNQTVFDLLVAQTFAAAPQKYIAGLVADDDDSLASALAKRVWTLDGADTKVGQLPGADLSHLVSSIDNTLRVYGIISQTPPNYLLGEMVNIAAEALVAADASLAMKVEDRETLHGESHENMFRLSGVAANEPEIAADVMSEIVWRQTDPRSFAATVDGLTKLASPEGLQVPPDELWTMIPGVTQTTAERWKATREQADPFAELMRDMDRQSG